MEKLVETVKSNELQNYRLMAKELLEDNESVDIVAAALRLMTKEPDDTPVQISEERPLPSKGNGGRGGGGKRDYKKGPSRGGKGGGRPARQGRQGHSSSSSSRGRQRPERRQQRES